MTPTDRAIRIACQGIVLLWIAAFLGWRALAPEEVRVPVSVSTTILETPEPEPALEETPPEPEELAEARPEPEPPEPEPTAEPEPEREPRRTEPLPEPAPAELAERDAPQETPEPEPPPPLAATSPAPAPPEPAAAPAPRAPTPPEPVAPALAEAAPAANAAPLDAPAVPLLAVDEGDVARGGTLLREDAGFPMLESRYESYGSFRDYAAAMRRLGAEFVVVHQHTIVGTIDPWTLETGRLTDPAALSPRARDYAGEPELLRAGRAVRHDVGSRAEVMMLVPRRMDAGLFGGIARALEARGREPSSYREIRARYERGPGGSLRLRVEAAVRRNGDEEPLPLLFDLDQLAGRGRA